VSDFLEQSVSDDVAPDAVYFISDVAVFLFVGAACLSFSLPVYPAESDDVMICWRQSTSGVFVQPFTITFFGEFVDGQTPVSRCVLDLSTAGVCVVSVFKGISVPWTGDDVFRELVADPVCVPDVISSCLQGSVVMSDSCVRKMSAVVDVGCDSAVTVALTHGSVFDDFSTLYDFIRSARDDALYGVDRTDAGGSTAADDCNTSDKSFIANRAAAAGDVILVRGAATVNTPSLAASPRRPTDRDRADITLP